MAIAVSLWLMVEFLTIKRVDNNKADRHERNSYDMTPLIEESMLDPKKWSWALFFIVLVSFPYSHGFFANFLLAFSFCAVVISCVVAINKIYTGGISNFCAVFYIPATVLIAMLTKDIVLHEFYSESIVYEFYGQLKMLGRLDFGEMYWRAVYELLLEFTHYIGMSLLFVSLINSCFGFVKGQHLSNTLLVISVWMMVSIAAHFLASGHMNTLLEGDLMHIVNDYKAMLNNFEFFDFLGV